MQKLPHWVLPDKFPALYDTESATAIEMTAKVYGAMNNLIEEYNKFVDGVNAEIEKFEGDTNKDIELFKTAIAQQFQDFIDVVELKIQSQDNEIANAIAYMKDNLSDSVNSLLNEIRENGELTQDILTAFNRLEDNLENEIDARETNDNNLQTLIDALTNRMNAFTNLEEGTTTGDAELIDARVAYNGKTYTNVGEHIRNVTRDISNKIDVLNATDTPHIDLFSTAINYTNGTYIANNGDDNSESVLRKSNFIAIDGFNRLKGHFTYNGNAQGHKGCFFDKDKNLICSIATLIGITSSDYDMEIPNNAKYLVLNALADREMDKTEGNFAYLYYQEKTNDIKTINILGDSITYGVGASETSKRYSNLLENFSNVKVNNYGLSASKISDLVDDEVNSFVDRVVTMETNADMVIIFGGTNDYWHKKTSIGTESDTDTSTFYGALNYLFEYINTNFVNKEILCVIPFKQYYASIGGNSDNDFGYGTLNDFRKALINRCEYHSIPYLDLYTMSGMDMAHNTTHRSVFGSSTSDCVHPNNNGHEKIAKLLANYINNIVW